MGVATGSEGSRLVYAATARSIARGRERAIEIRVTGDGLDVAIDNDWVVKKLAVKLPARHPSDSPAPPGT